MKIMKISDIKISESFTNSTPSEEKMNECRCNWNQWHRQDRYIVVNYENVLIDGYAMYLVLKENKIEDAEVMISNKTKKRWHRRNMEDWTMPDYVNESTTYVYGIHPNCKCQKEFLWRIPKSWTWLKENIQVRDRILCNTKFGYSPVIVTRVETLDKSPVNYYVKKVAKEKIKRDGNTLKPEN